MRFARAGSRPPLRQARLLLTMGVDALHQGGQPPAPTSRLMLTMGVDVLHQGGQPPAPTISRSHLLQSSI